MKYKRLTTEHPESNLDTMLNSVYAKGHDAYLRFFCAGGADLGRRDVLAQEALAEIAKTYGCEATAEDILDGCCIGCSGCPVDAMWAALTQAVEMRARLVQYEDSGLSPDEVKQLARAAGDGWTDIKDQYPPVGKRVELLFWGSWMEGDTRKRTLRSAMAIYEDGTRLEDDSDVPCCDSNDWDKVGAKYDEEHDQYIVPEGWYEVPAFIGGEFFSMMDPEHEEPAYWRPILKR